MGMIALCPSVKVVGESSVVEVTSQRDQCMLYAIQTLRANHAFRFGYDYTWVMMAINEGLVDDYDGFRSPQAFLDYLYEIGIEGLPTRFTLFRAYSKTLDSYPNWTFLDMDDAYEALWFAADLLDEEADATEKEEPYATKTICCYREAASEQRRFANEI